jgi:dTDP-glucose pyrophosphorylase
LVKEVEEPQNYGIFKQDEEGFAVSVVEKPQEYI